MRPIKQSDGQNSSPLHSGRGPRGLIARLRRANGQDAFSEESPVRNSTCRRLIASVLQASSMRAAPSSNLGQNTPGKRPAPFAGCGQTSGARGRRLPTRHPVFLADTRRIDKPDLCIDRIEAIIAGA
jgi:hypothetical protein